MVAWFHIIRLSPEIELIPLNRNAQVTPKMRIFFSPQFKGIWVRHIIAVAPITAIDSIKSNTNQEAYRFAMRKKGPAKRLPSGIFVLVQRGRRMAAVQKIVSMSEKNEWWRTYSRSKRIFSGKMLK